MPALNVRQALQLAREKSGSAGESSTLEAQVLLAEILARPRSSVLSHPELELDNAQSRRFLRDLDRLQAGQPLAYITGWQEFYGRRFLVTPDTLIPRPETEQLVELALKRLHGFDRLRLADVGTGAGCIAITLACEHASVQAFGTDRSRAALAVAFRNAQLHGVIDRVRFACADLLTPLRGTFDLICANLPYIPSARLARLEVARHEPAGALDGGADGMAITTRLIHQLGVVLAPDGCALLEIDAGQGDALSGLIRRVLPGCGVSVERDLAGLERILMIERRER